MGKSQKHSRSIPDLLIIWTLSSEIITKFWNLFCILLDFEYFNSLVLILSGILLTYYCNVNVATAFDRSFLKLVCSSPISSATLTWNFCLKFLHIFWGIHLINSFLVISTVNYICSTENWYYFNSSTIFWHDAHLPIHIKEIHQSQVAKYVAVFPQLCF